MINSKYISVLLLLLTLLLPFSQNVWAQGNEEIMTHLTLDSLVVTASRVPINYRKTGRRVVVYTAKEIAAQPAQTVAGLLRTLGGVAVQSRAGFGVQSDFSIRGSSFKGVLILLDGVPINGPQTAHYLTDFPVPLSAIARIEVLRGSASALYGPNAIGGVIQIFTYAGLRAADAPSVEWEGGIHAKYGSHNLYDTGGSLRHSFGNTTIYAATAWQGTEGEPIFDSNGERVRSINGPLSTDFTRQTHTLALTHAFDGKMFYARVGMDRRDLNAYHFYTGFDSDKARANNRTYWLQMRLRNDREDKTNWKVQLAAKQHEGLFVYNPKFASSRDYARKVVTQAQLSHAITPDFTLTGGISGEFQGIESLTKGNHSHLSGGIYAGANWEATNSLTVNGSSRIDYDAEYGVEVTPHLSLAYNFSKLTLRAAAGRAVRAPTYTELYINTAVKNPSGNLGNPDLKAEEAWTAEAGADLYVAKGLSLHSTVFYRTVDNLIDYSRLPGQDLFVARNILHAETPGLELGLNANRYFDGSHLSLNVFYTLLHKEIGSSAQNVDYKYALKGARQLIQGNLQFEKGNILLALRGLWKDRRTRKSYTLVHARAAYRIPLGDQRVSLSLSVRNIFNTEYSDIFDAPMPNRWWIFGVRLGL